MNDRDSFCQRNQFFISSFNGDITSLKEISKPEKKTETLSNGETAYICNIKIEADVTPANQINDPNFDFNVKFNNYNFRSGDSLEIEIGLLIDKLSGLMYTILSALSFLFIILSVE